MFILEKIQIKLYSLYVKHLISYRSLYTTALILKIEFIIFGIKVG